ncbi:hypothetical protein FRC17_009442 [Serendipita sp. 399]|nr:hypothetical protein FRC17_009442 [Serendipita sp. 399]
MKGTILDQTLPFIYSTTFAILSCLFAIAWLCVASVTLFVVAEFGIAINYRRRFLARTKLEKSISTFGQSDLVMDTTAPIDDPSTYPAPYSIPTGPGSTTMVTNTYIPFPGPQLFQCGSTVLVSPDGSRAIQQDTSRMISSARPVSISRSLVPPSYNEDTDVSGRQAMSIPSEATISLSPPTPFSPFTRPPESSKVIKESLSRQGCDHDV